MAKKAEILTSYNNGDFHIRVIGRATFDCSSALLDMIKSLDPAVLLSAVIDLSECTGMDSTFMGIISKLALIVRKVGKVAVIQNASTFNQELLSGLGIKKLFDFREKQNRTDTVPVPKLMVDLAGAKIDDVTNAETVLDAHETLISVDESNVNKFSAVVSMVRDDLEKMKKKD